MEETQYGSDDRSQYERDARDDDDADDLVPDLPMSSGLYNKVLKWKEIMNRQIREMNSLRGEMIQELNNTDEFLALRDEEYSTEREER